MSHLRRFKFPEIKNTAILSPMEGVTDVAFRELCKKYGAGITYTEFTSGTALVRGSKKSENKIKTSDLEKPVAVQLFGRDFNDVVSAAKLVEDKFDIIDINCGCPSWKVIKSGAGSEMLKKPEGIVKLVSLLVKNIDKPISVKLRLGIDNDSINILEVAQLVEKAGAAAIAIHGRTQKQGYSGKANWELIKKVKETAKIPVIGNGDVFTPEDFKEKLDYSKVDAIMIARGAVGNPYIFKQIKDYLETGKYDKKDKIEQFEEYLVLAFKHNISFSQIKSQAISFTKGIVMGGNLRKEISSAKSIEEIKDILKIK
ncbi:MAG TPA: tRNA dihydrouridine synthase DusB [Candidatus Nanoarchaeia archaeon]|nr:tRNA dihydrouridine synthase DusB [Candidatus Nanoarchaeia archaeon]